MKVFISWSGDRSRKLAEYLAGWLRKLPLTINPWVSGEAINPGLRWSKELSDALEGTKFGIFCLTIDNQSNPWICFEAGALSKTIEKTHVIPYLIDIPPDDLKQPIKQFQAIEATKEGTQKLIETIYKVSEDKTRSLNDLTEAFEVWWPKLSQQIEESKKVINTNEVLKEEYSLNDLMVKLDEILKIMELHANLVLETNNSNVRIINLLKQLPKRQQLAEIKGLEFYNAFNNYLREMLEAKGIEQNITENYQNENNKD